MTLSANTTAIQASDDAPLVPASVRFAVHPRAAWRKVAGEYFVVTPDRSFHRLTTATAVSTFAALTAAPATQHELVAAVVRQFEVTPAQAETDLRDFLATLLQRQVVTALETPAQAHPGNPPAQAESGVQTQPSRDNHLPEQAADRGTHRLG
jgi:hypothetical protein